MKKKVTFIADKAGQLLLKNPYKELMLRRVEEDKNETKKLQLYYALRFDKIQCDKCCHFYAKKKLLARHKRGDCLDINFQPKIKYA